MAPTQSTRPFGAAVAAAIVAFLVVGPTTVVARESISNQFSLGMCRKTSLGQELEMCSREGVADDLVAAGPGITTANSDIWSHTSPCYTNTTDGQEFCVFTSASFAGDHGITILTSPKRSAHFAQSPAFVHPDTVRGINRDVVSETEHGRSSSLPPLSYRVEAMPGKGYGVVATKFLNRGDLIMSTTASVVVDYALFDSMPEKEILKLQSAGIGSLPDLHRTRFMNLSTQDAATEGHDEIVAKILATNAFDIESQDDDDTGFFVVFPEISRLNHDCRPNADYHFDYDTMTQHIHAVRPIAAGEEITVSYMDLIKPRKHRIDKLKDTWGFDCGCSQCTQNRAMVKASDARIGQIRELRDEFQDYTTTSRATPEMAELFVSLYQQERLDAMMYEAYSYAAIEWNGAGEPWLAVKYARLAIESGLMSVGTRDDDVDEMRQLAADPWTHWSWMMRTSRRMQWGKKEKSSTGKAPAQSTAEKGSA